MTQYLLSVHHVGDYPTPSEDEAQAMFTAVDAFNTEVRASGAWVFAGGLLPRESATVVRVRDGEVLLTDGPFSGGEEQLGGFWVVEAPDLDAALDLGRRASVACRGPVEVRPFQGG